jgi:FKBP-type peptidyl-prolyl cis-trans isomerase 2
LAKINKGDIVIIEYTGRFQNGEVFETTDEGIARSSGIYDPKARYGPKTAIFGTKTIISGLEEAILSLEGGNETEVRLEPAQAFGKRLPELIRMMPEKDFSKQGIRPSAGMTVALDGALAMVKSVTSGRVTVDFNHPLAGENVIYRIKLHETIADPQRKIEAVLASFMISGKVEKDGDRFKITVAPGSRKDAVDAARQMIGRMLSEAEIAGIN